MALDASTGPGQRTARTDTYRPVRRHVGGRCVCVGPCPQMRESRMSTVVPRRLTYPPSALVLHGGMRQSCESRRAPSAKTQTFADPVNARDKPSRRLVYKHALEYSVPDGFLNRTQRFGVLPGGKIREVRASTPFASYLPD